MKTDVGTLRQQSAFADADRPVVIVSDDPQLQDLEVVEFYPDSGGASQPGGSFKIKVRRRTTVQPDVVKIDVRPGVMVHQPVVHQPVRTAEGNPAHGCETCDGEDACTCPGKNYRARCLGCGRAWPDCDPDYRRSSGGAT